MENNTIKNIENTQVIFFKNVSIKDKYNFYEYLSVMLDWWVSLIEALDSVQSRVNWTYFKEKTCTGSVDFQSWKGALQIADYWRRNCIKSLW